ncbi:MAG: prepilin peptidase, partial [Microcoleus sp. T1-bin1]|nr:prepilin peptidase [Microcoleus sp. T1-bin1]
MEIIFNSLVTAIVFVCGSAIGSFLNVVVYRLPAGLSVMRPPSRCPKCLNQLKPYENIPVFGWLWLRGRCNHCLRTISVRYP